MLMKYFIDKNQAGESPHPSHFHPAILPELESLYSSLFPMLESKNPFIYIASTGRGEGTSTIAWALAYYLAMREKKECLFVDGTGEADAGVLTCEVVVHLYKAVIIV